MGIRFALLILAVGALCGNVSATVPASTAPVTDDGEKWRIAYYEGGPYIEYEESFMAIVNALAELGWMEPAPRLASIASNRKRWEWLARSANSDYLEFVKDAFYSANWDRRRRKMLRARIIKRLKETDDIDLVIAAGTWAGWDLATDSHQVPVVAVSISDPIAAELLKTEEVPDLDHFHTLVEPDRYTLQLELFHNIVGFKTLGIVYEDTDSGRTYAAIDTVHKVAKDRGFKVNSCRVTRGVEDVRVAETDVIECFRKLAKTVDALYVTRHMGVNPTTVPTLARIAIDHRIPTFSQAGAEEVALGFLMSLSTAEPAAIGRFHAAAIARIFNGARPRDLYMTFETPKKIAINLETAEKIGFNATEALFRQAIRAFDRIERTPASE
jgi:ABC-type uncharacterized transport system substrate-binding protein